MASSAAMEDDHEQKTFPIPDNLSLLPPQNTTNITNGRSGGGGREKRAPKRFVNCQIPDSILNDPDLNAAIALLPPNYNFEIHKCVWCVRSSSPRAPSCTPPPSPTSSPPSAAPPTASSLATSPTVRAVLTTSSPLPLAPTSSSTTTTAASSPSTSPPSPASMSSSTSPSISTA